MPKPPRRLRSGPFRRASVFVLALLAIELLDEFVYGAAGAAWPQIRDDLRLSYVYIGLLLTVPSLTSNVVEPFIGMLGDTWRRRTFILGGGAALSLALLLTALSRGFAPLLLGFTLRYPTSGAFVYLSQVTLMDADPCRREQNMARWTLAGSTGSVLGPLALVAVVGAEHGWRVLYAGFAGLVLVLVLVASRVLTRAARTTGEGPTPLGLAMREGLTGAIRALRRRAVLRWLALLESVNVVMGVLSGFLALYLVDIGGTSPAQASLAVATWTGFGLLGNLFVIPLLERVRGLRLVRWSAAAVLTLYPAFLLATDFPLKLGLLALIGLLSSGWYAVLQAQLYATIPGQSGLVMTVGNLSGLVGGLVPLGLGLIAERFDLATTLWLLLLGPIALLAGIARTRIEP